jgi:cold shock protein
MRRSDDGLLDSRNEPRYRGSVVWFDPKKGMGFVKPDDEKLCSGKELFIHFHFIVHRGFKTLKKGDVVEFSLGKNHVGPCTKDVKVVFTALEE